MRRLYTVLLFDIYQQHEAALETSAKALSYGWRCSWSLHPKVLQLSAIMTPGVVT